MSVIVFDIGNVLVKWDPHLAWAEDLGSRDAADAFLQRTNFFARNLRGDKGERWADMALELETEEDRRLLASYPQRFALTVQEKITGSWNILYRLKGQGREVHAITNWSAETWPIGVATHPELGEVFGTTIVSGAVRRLKPEPEIFAHLCEDAGVAAGDCVFIDDSPANVAGARAFGMDTIHFTSPGALDRALAERELL
jgi:2-haloacid dehalogenase